MSTLFYQTRQNISLPIVNCFKEKELDPNSVVKDSLTTAKDGKRYPTKFYNLDVVISVGYRVKSLEGTRFRIWAIRVLKDYLLKGIAIHTRLDRLEDQMEIYLLGASLKDLGKKWFAFSKLEPRSVQSLLSSISAVI